ncbi:MAG: hypothetical protein K0S54_3664 [Alphaproteobacteria bacterium]|nr:hypothetical protein [Alphaproteobacteria bacterium]
MRNPLDKALWSIGLVLLGAGLALLGYALQDRIGTTAAGILGIIGLAFVPIFLFTFLWALT